MEAHINAIADDLLVRKELTVLERAILSERDFKLSDGQFEVTTALKIYRLEDRIEFLHRRFSGMAIDKNATWWANLKHGMILRNRLTHPKEAIEIQEPMVRQALQSVLDALDALYKAIYRASYPPGRRGLDSTMTF